MEIIIEFRITDSLPILTTDNVVKPNNVTIGYESKDSLYLLNYKDKSYVIQKSDVDELLKTLNDVNISKIPSFGFGVDGESNSLKISNGWNTLEFSWWSDSCGEQWKGLFTFREKLEALLNTCLK